MIKDYESMWKQLKKESDSKLLEKMNNIESEVIKKTQIQCFHRNDETGKDYLIFNPDENFATCSKCGIKFKHINKEDFDKLFDSDSISDEEFDNFINSVKIMVRCSDFKSKIKLINITEERDKDSLKNESDFFSEIFREFSKEQSMYAPPSMMMFDSLQKLFGGPCQPPVSSPYGFSGPVWNNTLNSI